MALDCQNQSFGMPGIEILIEALQNEDLQRMISGLHQAMTNKTIGEKPTTYQREVADVIQWLSQEENFIYQFLIPIGTFDNPEQEESWQPEYSGMISQILRTIDDMWMESIRLSSNIPVRLLLKLEINLKTGEIKWFV